MTTICYRGGVLAADTRLHAGGEVIFQERASKIWRVDHGDTRPPMIAGMSGDFSCQEKFEKFLLNNGGFPEWEQECSGISVSYSDPDPTVRVYGRFGGRYVVAPFVALGSGSAAALAAMHMGADARRAVEIAMLVDPFTGGEIDVLRLDGATGPILRSNYEDALRSFEASVQAIDAIPDRYLTSTLAETRGALRRAVEYLGTFTR